MKAIITGATGFLGSHLVRYLEEKGYQILALGRNKHKGAKLGSALTQFKSVDLTDEQALYDAFETADVVFHCAAFSNAWGKAEDFYQANTQATRHVLNATERYGIAKLVYVSSSSVYFNFIDKLNITEDQALSKYFVNDYAKTKYLGEQVVLQECNKTQVVIIRPRGIIGEGDPSIFPRILKICQRGFFPLIDEGKAVVDLTYVKNVAHALYLAGEKTGIHKHCFNISNAQPISIKDVISILIAKQNKPVKLISVPYFVIQPVAKLLEYIAKRTQSKEPILTSYTTGLLAKSQTLNIDKAHKILGYQPIYSLEHAIEQYFHAEPIC